MNFIKKSIYALSLVSMINLWSCSQDEVLPGTEEIVPTGQTITLTVNVNRGKAQTRTILSENKANGGLISNWKEGDYLHVYSNKWRHVGTIKLKSGEGTTSGVFSGPISIESGETSFTLWQYNEEDSHYSVVSDGQGVRVKVDVSKQNFFSLEELSVMDLMSSQDMNMNSDYVQFSEKDGEMTVKKDVTLVSKLAMACFTLNNLPTGARGTLRIYDVDKKLFYADEFNVKNTNSGTSWKDESGASITVEDVTDKKNEVYVALIPNHNTSEVGYTLGFEFTNTADGKVYTYEFKQPTYINPGTYYAAYDETAQAISGIPVELEEVTEVVGPSFQIKDRYGKDIWVKFTRANLHYDIGKDEWYFPQRQIDFAAIPPKGVGYNATGAGNSVIDLFHWGATGFTSSNKSVVKPTVRYVNKTSDSGSYWPYNTSVSQNISNSNLDMRTQNHMYVDWGWIYSYSKGNYSQYLDVPQDYFTLSGTEWTDLFDKYVHTLATVEGVPGLLMFSTASEDDAKKSLITEGIDVTDFRRLTQSYHSTHKTEFSWTMITISNYETLSKLNAVFLPAVGEYLAANTNVTPYYLSYWESKCTSSNGSHLFIRTYDNRSTTADFKPSSSSGKQLMLAVRLVKKVNGPDKETTGENIQTH